jgi:hypothetical protein
MVEKRWNLELVEGTNRYRAVCVYLHNSEVWNVVIKVNGLTTDAFQTEDPTVEALEALADAQELHNAQELEPAVELPEAA